MDLLIGSVIILVIILLYFIWLYYQFYNGMLFGLWETTDIFCTESEIDSMHLMIGDTYKACLIITSDNKIVVDETFDINFDWSVPYTSHSIDIKLDINSDIIPDSLIADIDLVKGIMIWRDDEQKYADFRRKYV